MSPRSTTEIRFRRWRQHRAEDHRPEHLFGIWSLPGSCSGAGSALTLTSQSSRTAWSLILRCSLSRKNMSPWKRSQDANLFEASLQRSCRGTEGGSEGGRDEDRGAGPSAEVSLLMNERSLLILRSHDPDPVFQHLLQALRPL